jgi:hypothetical protein
LIQVDPYPDRRERGGVAHNQAGTRIVISTFSFGRLGLDALDRAKELVRPGELHPELLVLVAQLVDLGRKLELIALFLGFVSDPRGQGGGSGQRRSRGNYY